MIPDPKDKLTAACVYNRVAVFFFGLIFLILSAGFFEAVPDHPWLIYLVLASFTLSFWMIGFLLVDFSAFYIAKTLHHFGKGFEKYKHVYGIVAGFILLVIFIIMGYCFLSREVFWQTFISAGVISVLGLIAFCSKALYEKHKGSTKKAKATPKKKSPKKKPSKK